MATCPTTPFIHLKNSTSGYNGRWISSVPLRCRSAAAVHCCSAAAADGEVVDVAGERRGRDGYLTREFGWGVRRMVSIGEEMKRVAQVQAEAFYEPVALFNGFFYEFFKAEVLSALIYRIRNSPPNRYACLVAEPVEGSDTDIVGVVDITVQRDGDILQHVQGAAEYLYVSGIAVLIEFRRQKVATTLLRACDVLSQRWGYDYLALRAYEDDSAARRLYSKEGHRLVSGDPYWVAWIGKKRRVLMVKHHPS